MKTIIKTALVAFVALTVGLVGCTKETTGTGPEKGEKSVIVKIAKADVTRAVGATVAAGEFVDLSSANVYFTAGSSILAKKTLTDAVIKVVEGVGEEEDVTIYEFQQLPGTITTVHVIGNQPTLTTANYTDITKLLADKAITLANQATIAGTVLYGHGDITATDDNLDTNTELDQYEVNVELNPLVTRLQLGRIYAKNTAGLPAITSFTLDGIYLDGVYTTMGFDRSVGTFFAAGENNAYPGGHATQIMDEPGLEDDNDYTPELTPAVGQTPAVAGIWAYNLLPATGSKFPTIILKVSDVVVEGDTEDEVAFPNANYYLTAKTTSTTFDPGYVYTITNGLGFDVTDLTEEPNQDPIDISVTIDVIAWKADGVAYNF